MEHQRGKRENETKNDESLKKKVLTELVEKRVDRERPELSSRYRPY